uniref:Uncharacterized protein n=1 Tax=Panagrolaimus sp. JU765 TaxID=591449 RepID=A0AC34REN8_9BILA
MFRRPASDSEGEDDYGGNVGSSTDQMGSFLEQITAGRSEESAAQSTTKNVEQSESVQKEEIFTRDDLNKLAAKVMKAELKGDMDKATKLKEKLEAARKQFETKNNSTIMVEMDRRTGTAKPAGYKTKHDRSREAEHEMLKKFINSDKTEEELKRKEDRRSRKRGPETEADRFNKLKQSGLFFIIYLFYLQNYYGYNCIMLKHDAFELTIMFLN